MKQIIVARKDLNMSAGKLAAQVSHASSMFIMQYILDNFKKRYHGALGEDNYVYAIDYAAVSKEIYEDWMMGEYKKCILAAKDKNDLIKLKQKAIDNDLVENKDFFLIYDNCHTELEAEENGTTLTCIGFIPMQEEKIDKVTKRYRLY